MDASSSCAVVKNKARHEALHYRVFLFLLCILNFGKSHLSDLCIKRLRGAALMRKYLKYASHFEVKIRPYNVIYSYLKSKWQKARRDPFSSMFGRAI